MKKAERESWLISEPRAEGLMSGALGQPGILKARGNEKNGSLRTAWWGFICALSRSIPEEI